MIRARIIGTGSYLPARVLANAELAATVDTSDEWIVERTGIRQRHIAAAGEFTSDLGTAAARARARSAGLAADDIDLIIVATATPDQTFPACATVVQHKLGMTHGVAFDIAAVCSGFLYALTVADALLTSGAHRTALVIGAETFSHLLDWEDRTTCVLFGDGAGAVVLRAETGTGTAADRGILATRLHSDGRYNDLLFVDGGPGIDGHHRQAADEGQGSVSPRRHQSCQRDDRNARCRRARSRRMSPGWCRIRPICASSKPRRESSTCRSTGWW